ncbi:MAG: hypothetical protein ACYS8Z_12775 [Planctomycetota bacterium]
MGFIRRTERGRKTAKQACEHLGLKLHKAKRKKSDEAELFEQVEE